MNSSSKKVTFPYLGASRLAFKMLLEDLGNEVVLPARPNRRTLSLGVSLAPEFACLPLKITLGTYVDALQRGAGLIVATGGVGPCRAGWYTAVQRPILEAAGYSFEMVTFEPLSCGVFRFLSNMARLNPARRSPLAVAQLVNRCWEQVKAFDDLERRLHFLRPREAVKGEVEKAFDEAVNWVGRARTVRDIRDAREAGLESMNSVDWDRGADPVKVGIVGEVYVVLEPATNLNMEGILGNLGVEVHRSIFLSGWTMDNAIHEGGGHDVKKAALRYLPEMVGGHGQDSVGHTVIYAAEGIDGVVHLAPFTCIPEIVAKSILPRVSEDLDIPVISFFLDEQTGEAGVRTRLEAFVDLLKRRREGRGKRGRSGRGAAGSCGRVAS